MKRSSFAVRTSRRIETVDITREIEERLPEDGDGICLVWSPHTTTAIAVNEGADPDVKADIEATLAKLFPHAGPYRHAEGNSDAHLKSVLIGPSETIPFEGGRLRLGRWQAVFLCEFDGPRSRTIEVYMIPGA
ncbi:MAG: YjbQ family protein [Candidatus Latescibacterota bacterium]|nr:MAG: YjbQ family protein [Candidatus Latescibacterota bacterium]